MAELNPESPSRALRLKFPPAVLKRNRGEHRRGPLVAFGETIELPRCPVGAAKKRSVPIRGMDTYQCFPSGGRCCMDAAKEAWR
jgi:hypothetical protein